MTDTFVSWMPKQGSGVMTVGRRGEQVMTHRHGQSLSDIAGKLTFRTIDGVAVRFAESDRRGADALLLSPWPESVFAYEATWTRLAERTHLVAIDLPGFGRSERRDALMTPRAMGEFIVRVCRRRIRRTRGCVVGGRFQKVHGHDEINRARHRFLSTRSPARKDVRCEESSSLAR